MSHAPEKPHVDPGGAPPDSSGPASAAADAAPDAAGMERILRRETHSSRAVASIIAAVTVAGICAYALLEAAVRAVGQPPWIIAPQAAAEQIIALPAGFPPLLLGLLGAVLAMAGLVFLLHAVLPGRRARHVLRTQHPAAVVVDDEVIAAALARQARLAANVTQEQVMVVVSRREVLVSIRPTSGVPLKAEAVLAAVRQELQEMGLEPMPEVRLTVATSGVVGA